MTHDRIHAREPAHDRDRYRSGTVRAVTERDGHAVFVVVPDDAEEAVELTVTLAVRNLVHDRLGLDGDSPVGERVWFREHGG